MLKIITKIWINTDSLQLKQKSGHKTEWIAFYWKLQQKFTNAAEDEIDSLIKWNTSSKLPPTSGK